MPDEIGRGITFEKALAKAEEIHARCQEAMSVCDILAMAHDAFHVLAEHGAALAELAREGRRRAN